MCSRSNAAPPKQRWARPNDCYASSAEVQVKAVGVFGLGCLGVLLVCASLGTGCGQTDDVKNSHGAAGSGGDVNGGDAGIGGGPSLDSGTNAIPVGCQLPPDQSSTAAKLAQAACAPVTGCCQSAGMKFDVTRCVEEFTNYLQPIVDAERCRGNDYDPMAVEQCANALEANAKLCDAGDGSGLEVCERIITGPETPGAPCQDDLHCHAGPGKIARCDALNIYQSTCIVTELGSLGSACDVGSYYEHGCGDGLWCSSGYCAKFVQSPVGGSCAWGGADCDATGYCDYNNVCVARRGAGETCDTSFKSCKSGLTCLPNGLCGGATGSACTFDEECTGSCVSGKCSFWPMAARNRFIGLSVTCEP